MAGKKLSKKERKLSDCLEDLLLLPVADQENREFLNGLGIAKVKTNNKMLIAARLFEKAARGDISAIKEIRTILTETEHLDHGRLAEIIEAVKNVG